MPLIFLSSSVGIVRVGQHVYLQLKLRFLSHLFLLVDTYATRHSSDDSISLEAFCLLNLTEFLLLKRERIARKIRRVVLFQQRFTTYVAPKIDQPHQMRLFKRVVHGLVPPYGGTRA